MNKTEAIAKMKEGKKVTHRFFSPDEWVTMQGNIIRMELGQEVWETDWELHSTNSINQ